MPTRDEIASFSGIIETISTDKKITIMEAIVHHCDETEMEIEVAATLVSSSIKSKLREEAQALNLMKKYARLPI